MTVTYMNGAGNDFMVIDARGQTLDFEALAKKLCKLILSIFDKSDKVKSPVTDRAFSILFNSSGFAAARESVRHG